ncbi:MAG: polysaccharide biosynthesis protein, partial [Lachnospiraceae bacterium]|nr:polysaccharide biosynthesis protein [Lachnospiraceae bacterium]
MKQNASVEKMKNKFHKEHWHMIAFYMIIYDILAVSAAYFLALWIRFDCRYSTIPSHYLISYLKFLPIYIIFSVFLFYRFRLYHSIWRFASYTELARTLASSVVTAIFHAIGITILFERMPISYYIFGAVIQCVLIIGVRFSYRFVLLERNAREKSVKEKRAKRIMLIGAGSAGQMILRDLYHAKEVKERIECIIDDNPNKWNRFVDGIPVVGGRDTIVENVKKYDIDKIYIAIPGASVQTKKEIIEICKETGCELKNLPSMYQFATGNVTIKEMKDVDVEDLLGREPIKVNMEEIFDFISGKTILVTGGGGSIGSELCRQIAGHNPKQLIIFDVYENNAYDIEQELKEKYKNLNLVVLIGSVRDSRKIMKVFEIYKPDVVYHAAAHKHVPLMETSPCESIKNNAIGTYKTAYAAMANGCKRFVLISTDKAVNPTNIMGASKRLCEMIIQSFDRMIKEGRESELPALYEHMPRESEMVWDINLGGHIPYGAGQKACTEFVAVRFGNVLGSNGSVIPLFKKQIANGGPVTVTHPDIIRYFMTIPEAVSLVLQAGTFAKGGEIFVLDMGSPVKIDTLARNLIKLSGFKPDVDIMVEYSGLRPGEKLYEEKLMAEEGIKKTKNELIHIGCPIPFDESEFLKQLKVLMQA